MVDDDVPCVDSVSDLLEGVTFIGPDTDVGIGVGGGPCSTSGSGSKGSSPVMESEVEVGGEPGRGPPPIFTFTPFIDSGLAVMTESKSSFLVTGCV